MKESGLEGLFFAEDFAPIALALSYINSTAKHEDKFTMNTELLNHFAQQLQATWGAVEEHPAAKVEPTTLSKALQEFTARLVETYPFGHPRYAGQMLKPPHAVAQLGYAMAMMINPNNHALDGGKPSSEMEKEVVAQLASMVGFGNGYLGHLSSGGTFANLEALWVARQIHPQKSIAYSSMAHYTHKRMCEVLGVNSVEIPCTSAGVMDMNALEQALQQGTIGTVVATAGTTGLGTVEPISAIVDCCLRYGVRVHVDAAYGGFFTLLAQQWKDLEELAHISRCDSVVIDPHKHGLQPYGCGCVLFKDSAIGSYYKHDSPYTYFSSKELHLGEISLECSRAGAAAAALWLTLACIPLSANGLGNILAACLRASRDFAQRMQQAQSQWTLYMQPQLDIVCYFATATTSSEISALSEQIFERAMNHKSHPIFTSIYSVTAEQFAALHPAVQVDSPTVKILRSVLMKPEHEFYIQELYSQLTAVLQECKESM